MFDHFKAILSHTQKYLYWEYFFEYKRYAKTSAHLCIPDSHNNYVMHNLTNIFNHLLYDTQTTMRIPSPVPPNNTTSTKIIITVELSITKNIITINK